MMKQKTLVQHHQHQSLQAFASDRGDVGLQNEHFSVSSDSSASTLSQDTTTNIAPPPMARPTENNKIAMIDRNTNTGEGQAPPTAAVEEERQQVQPQQSVWERNKPADVQGGSLRTWSFADQHKIDMIQVHMKTDGRPMNANRT